MALALRRPYRQAPASVAAADAAAVPRPVRGRGVAARGAMAVGSLVMAVARLVRLVATIVAAIIVAGIVLRVVGANGANSIVHDIHAAGRTLAGPFGTVFSVKNPKESIALNWGLAALVYRVVGHLLASLLARMAPTGSARRPVV